MAQLTFLQKWHLSCFSSHLLHSGVIWFSHQTSVGHLSSARQKSQKRPVIKPQSTHGRTSMSVGPDASLSMMTVSFSMAHIFLEDGGVGQKALSLKEQRQTLMAEKNEVLPLSDSGSTRGPQTRDCVIREAPCVPPMQGCLRLFQKSTDGVRHMKRATRR